MGIYILVLVMEVQQVTHSEMGNPWIPCSERYCELMSIPPSLTQIHLTIHLEMRSGLMGYAIRGGFHSIRRQVICISAMSGKTPGRKLISFQRALQAA